MITGRSLRPTVRYLVRGGLAAAFVTLGFAPVAAEEPGESGLPATAPAEIVGPAAKIRKTVAYQKFVVGNCSAVSTQCVAKVLTVRNKKQLAVTNVSCLSQVADPGAGADIWLANLTVSGPTVYDFYQPTLTRDGDSVDTYAVNAQTHFYANAGDTLSVQISTQTDISLFYCKIVGQLVTFR